MNTMISLAIIGLLFITMQVVYGIGENVSNGTSTVMSKIDTMNWKNYSSAIYGFKIKYPVYLEPLERDETVFFSPINYSAGIELFGY
jgi:hypothetical protein